MTIPWYVLPVMVSFSIWLFCTGLWLGYVLWGHRPKPRPHIVSQWCDVPSTDIVYVWTCPKETTTDDNTVVWTWGDVNTDEAPH